MTLLHIIELRKISGICEARASLFITTSLLKAVKKAVEQNKRKEKTLGRVERFCGSP